MRNGFFGVLYIKMLMCYILMFSDLQSNTTVSDDIRHLPPSPEKKDNKISIYVKCGQKDFPTSRMNGYFHIFDPSAPGRTLPIADILPRRKFA